MMSVRTKECNEKFVDIHGREIPAVIVEKTGEVAFPLSELQQTGVAIYQKSQFAKLATIEKQFDEAFYDYMLESAKDYLLMNKISFFTEDQILTSISNCKRVLTENKNTTVSPGLFKNRLIAEKSDHEITIQVSNKPSVSRSPQSRAFSPTAPKVDIKKHKSGANVCPDKSLYFDTQKVLDGVDDKPKEKTSEQETKNEKTTMRKEGESSFKLRPPKSKVLEKVALNEKTYVEHDVVVTFCEKRNCIWVQDKANHDILETIFKKVNEEAKYQKMVAKPWQFEKVYLAQDEGLWFRCKVMRVLPLTVFFLDYGNMAEVEGLKEVSNELAKIPCMAVRLTFKENEYIPSLEDELRIRILKQNDDGTYFVNVLKQSKNSSSTQIQNGLTKTERKPQPPLKFTKIPPRLCTLENEQVVAIIHEEFGNFFLRTKQCFEKERDIEKECCEYAKVAPSSESYDVNQIVLVRDGEKYYRAVIKKLNNNKQADVEFLDHAKKITVDLSCVKNISESLSRVPVTYFPGRKLKGYANVEFSEEAKNLISESISTRKKYSVILNDDSFDLFDRSRNLTLSELIQELEDKDDKVRLRNIKRFEPEIGVKRYLCSCYKESGDLKLVEADKLVHYQDSVIMQKVEDPTPYIPVIGEVCLCYHDETWYRCVVTRSFNKEYEVLLFDFGNVEIIKESDLRKPTKGITEIPALALPCRLIDLPDHPQVHDLLKKFIIVGEFYNFEVKGVRNEKWDVKLTAVYDKIRKTPIHDF